MSTRPLLLLLAIGALTGCPEPIDTNPQGKDTDSGDTSPTDADGDGWDSTTDCDDQDPDVHPSGTEVCDKDDKDEDCDGTADDLDPDATGQIVVYTDGDSDGYGLDSSSAQRCDAQAGEVTQGGDCDDDNAGVNPGAAEVCDDADTDEDCDGDADEDDDDVTGTITAYRDLDGDGHGDAAHPIEVCEITAGTAELDDDCNDVDYTVNPDGTEVCGGADEDCDGLTDDEDDSVTGTVTAYTDADADGYGLDGTDVQRCDTTGYATVAGDCDDSSGGISPGAPEVCDAADVDEDCDGLADDGDPDTSDIVGTYTDGDGDGYGDPATELRTCDPADDAITAGGDCDDTNAAVSPGATEVCDDADTDEDCDGVADDSDSSVDAASLLTWYRDADKDAWGSDTTTKTGCEKPAGYNANGGDCDDGDSSVNPGKAEVCNDGVDNNCDGSANTCVQTGEDHLTVALAEAKIKGASANTQLGLFADGAGDVDGDGVVDVLVGARNADVTTTNAGAAWIFSGPVAGAFDTTSAAYEITGDSSTALLGTSGATADLDGDGAMDLVLSAPGVIDGASTYAGAVHVWFGPLDAAETEASADLSWTSTTASNFLGWALTTGDVTGDGVVDLLFSAQADGALYVYAGPLDRSGGASPAITLSEAGLGDALYGLDLGDIDGDGLLDIATSDRMDDTAATDAGRVFVTIGATGTVALATDADAIIDGTTTLDQLGTAVALGGDANGDGYDDLVMGAPGADDAGTNRGAIEVFYGPISGSYLRTDADLRLDGPTTGTNAGTALAYAGDIDNDGAVDLAIGSAGDDSGDTDAGAVFLLYGPLLTSLDLSDADYIVTGESLGDQAGTTVAAAGDASDDGVDDLLIGAYLDDDGGHDAGAVFLLAGSGL